MRQYKTSLARRRRQCASFAERYRSDPEFRLAWLNRERERRGAPLLRSVDEIQTGWAKRSWAEKRGEA